MKMKETVFKSRFRRAHKVECFRTIFTLPAWLTGNPALLSSLNGYVLPVSATCAVPSWNVPSTLLCGGVAHRAVARSTPVRWPFKLFFPTPWETAGEEGPGRCKERSS